MADVSPIASVHQGNASACFGAFTLDAANRELRKSGEPVTIQGKPLELLIVLVERSGSIVSREELCRNLWGNFSGDLDDNLNHAVKKLREALEDSADQPRFIQTVPRRGYRFLAPVLTLRGETASPPVTPNWQPRLNRMGAIGCAVLIVALGAWRTAAIRPELSNAQEAEQAYRNGLRLMRQRNLPGAIKAVEEFQRALQLQPASPRVLAGLAEVSSTIRPSTASVEMAERAVTLDPHCGECQAVLGFLRFTQQWRWTDAENHLRNAMRLQPHDGQTIHWYAQLQVIRGKPAKALELIDEALRRDPELWNLYVLRAGALYVMRNYAAAVEATEKALALNLIAAWDWRSRAFFQLGVHREGVRALMMNLGAWTSNSPERVSQRTSEMVAMFDEAGLKGTLGSLLEETRDGGARPVHAFNRAMWQSLLGDDQAALSELEIGLAGSSFDMIYVAQEPAFHRLRGQARFQAVLEKMGLDK
jgi:DNA-binding winged helix-turn-helix (wHTH) protein/Tfp pilus assembly protein PilF